MEENQFSEEELFSNMRGVEEKEATLESRKHSGIQDQEEIDLFELLGIIWKRKKLIFALVFVVTALAVVYSLIATPVYRASAKIIPVSSGRGISIPIPGELMGFAGLLGANLGGGDNIIKAVLNSRELAKTVVQKYDLKRYIYPNIWDEETGELKVSSEKIPQEDEIAETFLKNFVQIVDQKRDGVIEISVLFPKHATLSAIVANEMVYSLQNILNQKAYTNAKRNRIFIEEQVKIAKANLERAENEFREFQEKYNVVAMDKQMEESIKLYAELVGMLSEREVRLGVLRRITTPDNPEAVSLEYEISELKRKLRELEEGQKNKAVKGYILDPTKKIIIPIERVPDVALEYIRKRRELEIQNEIYKVLLTALEKAKIDEAKEDISFQVIDYAYPPSHRFKPKRKLIVAASFASSALLGIFLAFVIEAIDRRKKEGKTVVSGEQKDQSSLT